MAANFESGQTLLGKYQLVRPLGQGGMAEVWLAKHLGFDEDRVIKVLLDPKPHLEASLRAEAKLLRQLQHPNIVRVEDVDSTEDGKPFLSMEWIQGQDLDKRTKGSRVPWEDAVRVGIAVCAALEYAHSRGVIHRDIKPQNILIQEGTNAVKLIDFGIAKVREDAEVSATGMLTVPTGIFIGTAEYASPEQAEGMSGAKLDGRTDIYSVGLVLYRLIAGTLPFSGEGARAVLIQRLLQDPRPLRSAAQDRRVPAGVEAIVMKALAREREQRFASAAEMRAALEKALAPQQKPAPPAPSPNPAPDPPPHRPERRTAALAGLAVVALGVTLAAWQPWRQQPSLPEPKTEAKDVAQSPEPPPGPVAGDKKQNPKDSAWYAWIPSGTFALGCSDGDNECDDDERPRRAVTISKAFRIGQTDVTVAQWKKVRGGAPAWSAEWTVAGKSRDYNPGWKDGTQPVIGVTWDEAAGYCREIGGRLPTAAEWEYAARAGSKAARYGELDRIAWYGNNSGRSRLNTTALVPSDSNWDPYQARLRDNGNGPHAVAGLSPNAWGLHDTLGNVWEWVADWYDPKHPTNGDAIDPKGPATGKEREVRGGSWLNFPRFLRASYRYRLGPSDRSDFIGFRCVWE